jgi:hypothetical protein
LDVCYEGYVFRLQLAASDEIEATVAASSAGAAAGGETSMERVMRTLIVPPLHHLGVRGLRSQFPSYSGAVKLMSAWAAQHCFTGAYSVLICFPCLFFLTVCPLCLFLLCSFYFSCCNLPPFFLFLVMLMFIFMIIFRLTHSLTPHPCPVCLPACRPPAAGAAGAGGGLRVPAPLHAAAAGVRRCWLLPLSPPVRTIAAAPVVAAPVAAAPVAATWC